MGAEENPNPPLAKSEWLKGGPDRPIAAVLYGLVGPIEVKGRLYNSAMPPQSGLSDDQLAAILTHVRSSWGNQGGKVTAEKVGEIRKKFEGRTEYFSSKELLDHYPIPYPVTYPRLKNLISHVYQGKWEEMPDFSTMEPNAVEEEARGYIDVSHAGMDKEFGIVWTGILETKEGRDYHFFLDASDGAAVYVNGQLAAEVEGVGDRGPERARMRRFKLEEGDNDIRIEYFSNQENPGLSLQVKKGKGEKERGSWLSESRLDIRASHPAIVLEPKDGRAAIYRNFIKSASPKVIGVGHEGGVNQAFSIDHLGPDLIWHGAFIDAGLHWTGRGDGAQSPEGKGVVQLLKQPAYAILENREADWPTLGDASLTDDFRGYSFNEEGDPVFRYQIGDLKVTDVSTFAEVDGKKALFRRVEFEGGGSALENLYLGLAVGPKVEERDDGYLIDGTLLMKTKSEDGLSPIFRANDSGQVLVPLNFEGGKAQLSITYTWVK